ncbi:MAG: hypothetical protein Q3979_08425 [Actinomycetaceae bacterium]|nr:hypothetical protein [Actinomycetaceae bacterium]
MDQQMDALWWQAQRRIDYALAGMCACSLWMVVLPLIVLLTPTRWSNLFLLGLLACLPIGLVFLRPLDSGRRVVRAIGQRDAEEVARWRESAVPPAHPDLVRRRMWTRRPRLPMLCVVACMAAVVAVLALIRRVAPDYPAMAQYSLGIAVVSVGVCLSAIVQMFRGRVGNRTLLAGHILVIWLVPLGVGIASMAMITGRQDIATAVAARAMTAMVYVIFGLVGVLVTVVMAALWFALVTVLVQAPKIDDDVGLRGILPAKGLAAGGRGREVGDVVRHGERPDGVGEPAGEGQVPAQPEGGEGALGLADDSSDTSGVGGPGVSASARHDFLSQLEAGVNVDGLLASQAPSEFDEADVAAVREELAVQRSDYVIAGVIVGATASIFALACAGLSGTPAHVVVGVVLAAAVSMQLYRMIS